jgi:hypothetical protein
VGQPGREEVCLSGGMALIWPFDLATTGQIYLIRTALKYLKVPTLYLLLRCNGSL